MSARTGRGLFEGAQITVLGSALVLSVIGVLLVYSAATGSRFTAISNHHWRQLLWFALGMLAFTGAAAIPFTLYEGLRAYFGWGVSIVLLVLVLFIGESHLGARRWLNFGGISLQPSELAKLATVVDLGTALSFPFILFCMLYWAGLPLSYLALLASPVVSLVSAFSATSWGVFAVAFVFILWWSALHHRLRWVPVIALAVLNLGVGIATPQIWDGLKDYQKDRITSFLNPARDRYGSGYQIIQSEIAIGSGGLGGQGYLKGTQKNFQFLPEKHTDFVFSVAGEEFGFFGCSVVMGLYFVLFSGVIAIARRARSRFASLMAFGIGAPIFFHVVINIAMTVGFAPVTGLPLPFLSYGGTALLVNLLGLGLVVGVGRHRHEY
jgi:rod shape determining protein RodA